ncbi:MAG TPA: DHA2 family efflux MFS transporter permease subunit [Bacteroidia bacterium]|nr:DHA2 family efflux MFS transporter permease subunit [Bacteroidia bacterium]
MAEKGFAKWIIVITVILAALLELIDSTVVNVALNQIMGNLGATLEDVAWVVTAYAVANVIILPMNGWLSARFGRKNYFAFSIILFTASSFLCGNAHNIWELIFFRFIQGIGGGALLSTSQSILFETFKPEERGMATAIFGIGVVLGPTFGPTLGGWITDHYSWPWIFYINVPLGIIAAILTITYIQNSTLHTKPPKTDWIGIALLVAGIASLQIVLERGASEDWFETRYITVLAAVAAFSLITFVWWELRTEHPVVNFQVLIGSRQLAFGMMFTFILGFGLYASLFIFPIFVQGLLGWTAEQTGLLLMPSGLVSLFVMPTVGVLLRKGIPPQYLATIGFIMFFIFTHVLSVSTLASGWSDFMWPQLLRGIGMGFMFVPITNFALGGLAQKDIHQGTGLNNMMRQLGGSFGIAAVATFINNRTAFHRATLLQNINIYDTETQQRLKMFTGAFMGHGYDHNTAQTMAAKALDGAVIRQSMLLSYMDNFWIVGIFFLCCIPLLIFQPKTKQVAKISAADAH